MVILAEFEAVEATTLARLKTFEFISKILQNFNLISQERFLAKSCVQGFWQEAVEILAGFVYI